MTTYEALTQARALIDTPEKWVQKWFVDRKGRHCPVGALLTVCRHDIDKCGDARELLDAVAGENIVRYNDTHTHADVMCVFDRAIFQAEEDDADRYNPARC